MEITWVIRVERAARLNRWDEAVHIIVSRGSAASEVVGNDCVVQGDCGRSVVVEKTTARSGVSRRERWPLTSAKDYYLSIRILPPTCPGCR